MSRSAAVFESNSIRGRMTIDKKPEDRKTKNVLTKKMAGGVGGHTESTEKEGVGAFGDDHFVHVCSSRN